MHIVSNFWRLITLTLTWNIDKRMNEEEKSENTVVEELKTSLKIAVHDRPPDLGPTPYKVAIVGMNELGSATAFLLICRQVVTDVILIDRNPERLAGRNLLRKFPTRENRSISAEYADLSTCTTFVSGVNVQASNQLASCEGARVVILCDVSDNDDDNKEQTSTETTEYLANFKIISRTISVYGMRCKEVF